MFILCQVVSLLVAIFLLNFIRTNEEYNNYRFTEQRSISVMFEDNMDELDKLYSLLSRSSFVKNIEYVEAYISYENKPIKVLMFIGDKLPEAMRAGKNITQTDIDTHRKAIVLNPRYPLSENTDNKVGDTVRLFEGEYEIIGFSTSIDCAQIPYSEDLKSELKGVNFVYKGGTSDKDAENILSEINREFDFSTVEGPEKKTKEAFRLRVEDIIVVLSLIIVNVNFSALYFFILDNDKRTFAIMRMCGCTKRRELLIILGEAFLICIFSFALSVLLFAIIGQSIFAFIYPSLRYTFSTETTANVLILYVVSIIVIFLPGLLRFNKRTAGELYKREE